MPESRQASSRRHRLLVGVAGAILLLLAGAFLAVKAYLLSPLAPRQLGAILTKQVGQQVTVAGLRLSMDGVVVDGLRIDNPRGFAGPPLVEVGKLAVVPVWSELVSGRYRLASITITRVRMTLAKNDAGVWNFSGLVRRPKRAGKAPEVIVDRLGLADVACVVAGQRVDGVSATITGLATRGSQRTVFGVSGLVAGTQLALSGDGRLGDRPEARFTLTAPRIVPPAAVKGDKALALGDAVGSLLLHGSFNDGRLAVDGTAALRGGAFILKGAKVPVAADLALRGGYRIADDTATLE